MLLVIQDLLLDLEVILNDLSPSSPLLAFFFSDKYLYACVLLSCMHAYYTPQAQLNILLTETERRKD